MSAKGISESIKSRTSDSKAFELRFTKVKATKPFSLRLGLSLSYHPTHNPHIPLFEWHMKDQCQGVSYDLTNRINQLNARIYTHQNMIDQVIQERYRLQCILDNLDQSDDGGGDGGSTPAPTSDPVFYGEISLSYDDPWQ